MRPIVVAIVAALALLLAGSPWAAEAAECDGPGGETPSRCLYRAGFPAAGLVAQCRTDRDCRVGYYYGGPGDAVWLALPPGFATLPKPEVTWHTPTLAEARFACGPHCAASYFLDARRKRLSAPRADVVAVEHQRQVLAAAEGRALVVRQTFSGRELLRIERDWIPVGRLPEALTAVRFDPDGRLSVTWRRAPDGAPVTERVTVPALPR